MSESLYDPSGQIRRLATFIYDEIPGEPSQSESAVDTAIRLMKKYVVPQVHPHAKEPEPQVVPYDAGEYKPTDTELEAHEWSKQRTQAHHNARFGLGQERGTT